MKILVVFSILVLAGCASYKTYNQTNIGSISLRGGVSKKESWDDSLRFKRMSWYHGMTLYYDALFWKAELDSPFSKWFSPAEKEFFTKCESFIVTAGYSADPSKISHVSFREQMKLNGYDDIILNNFSSYLKSHPSAVEWRLQNYRVIGFCKRSPTQMESSKLIVNFPNFKQLELNL